MFDFVKAAFPWVVIGLSAAIACANMDKLTLLMEKWSNSKN